MLKRIRATLARVVGFDIVRYRSPLEANLNLEEDLGYELEDEATECIEVVRGKTMLSKRRLVTLYQQVVYCEKFNIPGALVECGVWKGGAVGIMALANLRRGMARRPLHLFDAFQEICEPDASVDGERAIGLVRGLTGSTEHEKGRLQPVAGIYDSLGGPGTLGECRELLEGTIGYPGALISYHVGWFQETLPAVHEQLGPIAVLRLDGNWYESTKVCLDYLFDKVALGGIVVIDDYGTYDGCRRAVDEFMDARRIQAFLGSVDGDCRYFVKLGAHSVG